MSLLVPLTCTVTCIRQHGNRGKLWQGAAVAGTVLASETHVAMAAYRPAGSCMWQTNVVLPASSCALVCTIRCHTQVAVRLDPAASRQQLSTLTNPTEGCAYLQAAVQLHLRRRLCL
jgi:hypothetical protein